MAYLCAQPVGDQCLQWVEQSNFITELSMLSYSDVNMLLSKTAALFALAWVCRLLSRHAYKH